MSESIGGKHFFEYRHPVEGMLGFYRIGGIVRVDCDWPFDRDLGEWITIRNEFDAQEYQDAVETAASGGRGEVNGSAGGWLRIWQRADSACAVELSNTGAGELSRSLYLILNVPLEDLYLSR